jgi:hypothetical protein
MRPINAPDIRRGSFEVFEADDSGPGEGDWEAIKQGVRTESATNRSKEQKP